MTRKKEQPLDLAAEVLSLERRLQAAEDAIARLLGAFPIRAQVVRTGQIITASSPADLPKDGSWRLMECNVRSDGSLR